MKSLAAIILCLALALAASCAPSPPAASPRRAALLPATQPTIIVGVFQQPASLFPRWHDRGCNVIVTDRSKPDSPAETPVSRTNYFRAASDAGLRVICGPDPAGPGADTIRPGFLAFNQIDEPENWGKVIKRGDGSFDWPMTTAAYRQNYADLKRIAPNVPVFGNFNGNPVGSARETDLNPRNVTLPIYREFAKGVDWISADSYVAARGREARMYSQFIGGYLDKFDSIKPGARKFAVLETCDQGLTPEQPPAPTRNPTPADVRAQVWISLIHGATGYIFFPLRVQGGFQWDATPADVAAALPLINAEVLKYERFILNGQLTKNAPSVAGATQEGTWTLAGSGVLKAAVTFDAAAKQWAVKIDDSGVVVIDPEKEQMRERLKQIEEWIQKFPKQ